MARKSTCKRDMSYSKFSSPRPSNVFLSSNMPRNICMCQYHENVKLIRDCLSKKILEFPSYSGNFVHHFVCSSGTEECMLGKCNKCPNWLDTIRRNSCRRARHVVLPNFMSRGRLALADFCGQFKVRIQNGRQY